MSETVITWSAVFDDRDAPSVTRRTTQFLSVITPSGDAAARVLRWWLEDEATDNWNGDDNWTEEFGADATDATAHVMIHEPADLAGLYQVELERKITARGYEVADCDAPEVVAMLSAAKAEVA